MKHNKMLFLFPLIILTAVLLFTFSCYPGAGPGAKDNDDNNNGDNNNNGDGEEYTGEKIALSGEFTDRNSIIMPMNDTFPFPISVTITDEDGNTDTSNEGLEITVDNTDVVEVDEDGNINSLAQTGDARITIKSSSSSETSATIDVRVVTIAVRPTSGQISKKADGSGDLQMEARIFPGGQELDSIINWYVFDNASTHDIETEAKTSDANIDTTGKLTAVLDDDSTPGVDVIASSTYSTAGKLVSDKATIEIVASTKSIVRIMSSSPKLFYAAGETVPLYATVNGVAAASGITWDKVSGDGTLNPTNGTVTIGSTLGDTVVKATDGTGGTATFTVQARSLRIAPAGDLSIELLSSGYQLKAMLSDGTNEIAADVTWKLDKEPVLSLGKVNLSASGLLTASGLAVVGNATVRAISNDNPAISATGDITFVSVLTIL